MDAVGSQILNSRLGEGPRVGPRPARAAVGHGRRVFPGAERAGVEGLGQPEAKAPRSPSEGSASRKSYRIDFFRSGG